MHGKSNIKFGFHLKYALFLPDFKENRIFSTDFRKKTQISDLTKILPVDANAKLHHVGSLYT
jgi:hypothetical protein